MYLFFDFSISRYFDFIVSGMFRFSDFCFFFDFMILHGMLESVMFRFFDFSIFRFPDSLIGPVMLDSIIL